MSENQAGYAALMDYIDSAALASPEGGLQIPKLRRDVLGGSLDMRKREQ